MGVIYFSALGLFLVPPEKLHTLERKSKGAVGKFVAELITQVHLVLPLTAFLLLLSSFAP